MEFRQLEYFRAVAEELHFQRAARRVGITQPSLSAQIKALEIELACTLLDRDRKSVALTGAGKALLAEAKILLNGRDRARDRVLEAAGQEKMDLKIGTRFFIGLPVFTQSVVAAKQRTPALHVEQVDMPTNEVPDAVKEGSIDLGFAAAPVTIPSLITKPVKTGHFVVVLPNEHPLAQEDTVSIKSLKKQPLIFFARQLNPVLFDHCVKTFKSQSVAPSIAMETTQVTSGLSMVKEGVGGFFVADYVVQDLDLSLKKVRIEGFEPVSIVAVWHENNHSKALQLYLSELRSLLDTN